jgi:hypothetical protein
MRTNSQRNCCVRRKIDVAKSARAAAIDAYSEQEWFDARKREASIRNAERMFRTWKARYLTHRRTQH